MGVVAPSSSKFCVVDAETEGNDARIIGVAFWSNEVQKYETSIDAIRKQLFYHAHEGYTFLAHNARYDVPIIWRQCNLPIKIIEYNGRFNRAEWKYHGRKPCAQVWDTLDLSGGLPLWKLGQAIGVPKYETPQILQGIDPDKYKWKCDLHGKWECIECYCIRDAEIPFRFMQDFAALLHSWGITPKRRIAAISMEAWKTFDNPDSIYIQNSNIRTLGRESYHGGRVETYKLGHVGIAYMADICSAYPAAMLETPMPDPHSMTYLENMPSDRINWNLDGVAECTIEIPPMYNPPLPYNDGNKRLYPIGIVRGCWPILEIRYAQSLGCIVRHVHRIAFAARNVQPFTNFVNTLWELRQHYESQNDPRTILAKLLLNNLYGRIGMKESLEMKTQEPKRPNTTLADYHGYTLYKVAGETFVEQVKTQRFRNNFANVVWAANITAAVRVKLHHLMMLQGNNVVYCDTDSIFSMQPIVGLGEGLGQLRDHKVLSWLYIAQPKMYAYGEPDGTEKWKAKGVPMKYARKFILDGYVEFDAPIRPMEQFRRKKLAGEWVQVHRTNHHVPHRRQPLKPVHLLGEYEWTDTQPPIIG